MDYPEILRSAWRIDSEIDSLRNWIAETELEDVDNDLDRLLESLAYASDAVMRHLRNSVEN